MTQWAVSTLHYSVVHSQLDVAIENELQRGRSFPLSMRNMLKSKWPQNTRSITNTVSSQYEEGYILAILTISLGLYTLNGN